jgi:CRISPR-associated protein (TIGR03986 family)
MSFDNPYNFLPALPRIGEDGAPLMPEGLGDGAPPGHHRWHRGRWSGEIAVTLRVITPLLLMRQRTADEAGAGDVASGDSRHRHLEVATTSDGLVDLAPTQLKGMLRSVYEAVTNSRFGVFQHDARLGHRQLADGKAGLRPAIVQAADQVLIPGCLVLNGNPFDPVVKVEAWSHQGTDRTWLHPGFAHGDEVDAVIRPVGRGAVRGWQAESLHRRGEAPSAPGRYVVRGRLHAPGPTIKGKRSERLFVTEVLDGDLTQEGHQTMKGEEGKKLVHGLLELVEHQRSIHRSAGSDDVLEGKEPWKYAGHEPGRTAWSRHLYDLGGPGEPPPWVGPDTRVPPPAGAVTTCWYGTGPDRLQPVMIGRSLYRNPPGKLLHESLHPAATLDELSPADRVFGWAWQRRGPDDQRPDPAAHRGQLRVVRVRAPRADDAVENLAPLTIAPLSIPKPSQGRFYLGEKKAGGTAGPMPPKTERGQFFDPRRQVLRGRKVYPHQQGLEDLTPTQLRGRFDYDLAKPDDRPLQDSQNATLHQWVRPGAEFTFTVQVSDLGASELGALLWLLDPARSGKPARYRLGMGKPLGFGSVELSVRPDETHLYTGERMADRLEALADRPEPADWSGLAAGFETAMSEKFGAVLAAVRTALVGFAAGRRVHYPRTAERRPTYEWFTANEKGCKEPLPLLGSGSSTDDPGA